MSIKNFIYAKRNFKLSINNIWFTYIINVLIINKMVTLYKIINNINNIYYNYNQQYIKYLQFILIIHLFI